jgi:hypothetical protein
MQKLGIFASLSAFVAAIALAAFTASPASADDPTPCTRKEFKTDMVKTACAKGGQPAAKDAMKAFNKEKKISSCNKCHSKLAPSYDLKADGLKQFNDLGGK